MKTMNASSPLNTPSSTLLWLAIIVVFLLLQGCVIAPPPKPDDPYYSPVMGASLPIESSAEGSLYRPGLELQLYGDRKANRIGDIITIVLDERTVSSKTSSTSVKKENDVNFNEDTGGGLLLGTNPTFKNLSMLTNLQQDRDFNGEAEADQSNRLQGNITVTVADVLPNGNLVVRGEKWMTLNQGEEFIRVAGVLRPQDVNAQNMASSLKLANARITYSGTGTLADANSMGWMSRVFNSVFWPF